MVTENPVSFKNFTDPDENILIILMKAEDYLRNL